MQHGFTVAAAAATEATTTDSFSSSDSDNKNGYTFAPTGATLAGRQEESPRATPPPASLGALGAALASADAETDSEEAYDAFSSSSEGEKEEAGNPSNFFAVDVVGTRHRTPAVRALARAVVRGLRSGNPMTAPEGPSPEGLGGSYVFRDERGRPAAIVKPCDEEALAPNNPKGFVGRELGDPGLRPTVRVGQAALREVAAYLLDHGGLARVPPTVLVRMAHQVFHVAAAAAGKGKSKGAAAGGEALPTNAAPYSSSLSSAATAPPSLLSLSLGPPQKQSEQQRRETSRSRRCPTSPASSAAREGGREEKERKEQTLVPKLASLQQYVRHDGDAADAGASRFSVRDVHAIGILDIRLLNSDRHAGNLLVRRREEEEEEKEVVAAAPATAASSSSQTGGQPLQQQQHPSTSLLARFDAAAARAARGGRPPLELVPIDHGES